MKFSRLSCLLLLMACAWCLTGCLPSAQGQLDEEKEPHFLAGKSRANALDFKGAIESFEKAIEVNPRSARAHFELAVLCEQRGGDPAAAIYHYERYLRLLPGAGNADTVKTHILACKQELARSVSLGPVTQTLQKELEKLTEENKGLLEAATKANDENAKLKEEIKDITGKLESLRGSLAARPLPPTNPPVGMATRAGGVTNRPGANPVVPVTWSAAGTQAVSRPFPRATTTPVPTARTHVVKSGETLAVIARQYGVRVESLQAANPGIDARRLRPGRTLKVPGAGN